MSRSLLSQAAYLFRRAAWLLSGTTPVSSVHPAKKDTCKYKFDPAIVHARSRRRLLAPKIDVSNLPAPDARVVAILKTITVADIETLLKQLSGEVDDTVGGATVRILSRNSFTQGLDTAMKKLEEYYAGLKLKATRFQYTKSRRTLNDLEVVIAGTGPGYVIYGAHLDSTAGDTWRAEKRAPGADDDGSGTVMLMLLAKAILALKAAGFVLPTIRLVHFTGEEQGLWGSQTYSDQVAKDNVRVRMVNTDMIGYCNKPGNRVELHDNMDKTTHDELVVPLVRAAARYKLNLNVVDTHDHAVENRHDGSSFLDHGIPAVCISEEFSEDGFNPNYHSVNDRINAMNLPFMAEVIRMVIAAVPDIK